jgi:tRNA (uracil-5-)-methyltransferase
VGTTLFEFPANSFFQNNNSVLVPLTEYVREAIISRNETDAMGASADQKPTHLVDTYCGSGLFAITLSPYFDRVAGIEISEVSIGI